MMLNGFVFWNVAESMILQVDLEGIYYFEAPNLSHSTPSI